jgi:anti-anti-sigma factor
MSLKANITHEGDVTIVELQGKLNFENQQDLRSSLADILLAGRPVVVDMNDLDFIGSSGVTNFIQTIREVSQEVGATPRFCNVSREFRKIMHAFRINQEMIHDTRADATAGFFRSGANERN